MKITVLIEDSVDIEAGNSTGFDGDLAGEFGLSLFIESDERRILLDTGTTGRFAENADILGIDLEQVDAAVISHSHFDHGGGLETFFRRNTSTPVYLHPGAEGEYYSNIGAKLPMGVNRFVQPLISRSRRFSRYIGLDRDLIRTEKNRIRFVSEPDEILPGVFILTDILDHYPKPGGNQFLFTVCDGRMVPDPFDHEIILVVREDDGLVLFSGCCHNGIRNLVATVRSRFETEPVKAVVGGFHLRLQPFKEAFSGTRQDIEQIGDALKEQDIRTVFTGHCTGQGAYDVLAERLGENLHPLGTGAQISIYNHQKRVVYSPYPSFSRSASGINRRAAELMQYLRPVGWGPSLNR